MQVPSPGAPVLPSGGPPENARTIEVRKITFNTVNNFLIFTSGFKNYLNNENHNHMRLC
jgi:hypothetical protein